MIKAILDHMNFFPDNFFFSRKLSFCSLLVNFFFIFCVLQVI